MVTTSSKYMKREIRQKIKRKKGRGKGRAERGDVKVSNQCANTKFNDLI